ncbi:hypothetical protein GF369_04900 [Candidatus Peregrinibacteria bacterium]|nr:hypothetical protein [Candidatus Peregrinibacteria bacterium]
MFTFENYSPKAFIEYVMDKMNLNDAKPDVKKKIEKEIVKTLGQRIITSVVNSMTEEDMMKYEILRDANPKWSKYEVLFAFIDEMPTLHEVMMKGVNDLAQELIYDTNRLDEAIEKSKNKTKKQ